MLLVAILFYLSLFSLGADKISGINSFKQVFGKSDILNQSKIPDFQEIVSHLKK